jgi:oxalate decarboxylase/phosphoglucose isomerase-like protein (cupin superfamily)
MKKNDTIRIITLPKIEDDRGNLSFIEEGVHIPFKIKRTYWVYDVPGGECRGSHAFKNSEEFIVALSGSFDIILHDGSEERKFSLNRSYYGLYIPRMVWRKIENFSTNSLALILSSVPYKGDDYIRDFNQFLNLLKK